MSQVTNNDNIKVNIFCLNNGKNIGDDNAAQAISEQIERSAKNLSNDAINSLFNDIPDISNATFNLETITRSAKNIRELSKKLYVLSFESETCVLTLSLSLPK